MHLLVIVLNEVELLDELLQSLSKAGVTGATVIDSSGMGQSLAKDSGNSVFSGIRSIYSYSYPQNKTIFSVIKDKELLEKAVQITESLTGGLCKKGKGILFTLPLDGATGLLCPDGSY